MICLGVNCSANRAFLAVADDGVITDGFAESIDAAGIGESEEELKSVLRDFEQLLQEVGPDAVGLLKPEGAGPPSSRKHHSQFVTRISLESMVRLASALNGIPLEQLARPTVRARLELPSNGGIHEHTQIAIPAKVGSNWGKERQAAALAALAAAEGLN